MFFELLGSYSYNKTTLKYDLYYLWRKIENLGVTGIFFRNAYMKTTLMVVLPLLSVGEIDTFSSIKGDLSIQLLSNVSIIFMERD